MPTHATIRTGQPIQVADYQKRITLTDAMIKALPNTPIEILPTPGDGKIIFVTDVVWFVNIVTGYTLSDASPITNSSDIVLTWGANEYNANQPLVAPLILDVQNLFYFKHNTAIDALGALTSGVDPAVGDNKSICVASDSENGLNYIGGNAANTIKITVSYIVADI